MDVSVIIVNYKTKALTCECIRSISGKTTGLEYEIIVVDNNSDDGSVETIRNSEVPVVVIENDTNQGFGKANNLGVRRARGKYVFFLNSDTVLKNNAIKLLYDYYEKYRILNGENTHYVLGTNLTDKNGRVINSGGDLPDIKHMVIRSVYMYLPWLLKARRHINPVRYSGAERDVGFVNGADMFMDREFFVKLGGFDSKIFMYCEDADLCLRASRKGAKCHIISGPRIVHLESQSSGYSKNRRKIEMKSNMYYIRKNLIFKEIE